MTGRQLSSPVYATSLNQWQQRVYSWRNESWISEWRPTARRYRSPGRRGLDTKRITPVGIALTIRVGALGLLSASLLAAGVQPASAESYLAAPPDHFVVTPGGVDLRSGRYTYTHTDLSIGGDPGLQLTRSLGPIEYGYIKPFGNLSHNLAISVTERRVNIFNNDYRSGVGNDFQIKVEYSGLSDTFRSQSAAGSGFYQVSTSGYATLTYTSGDRIAGTTVYTYQSGDGATITFRPIGSNDCSGARCAYVSQIARPDGTVLNFEYDNNGSGAGTTRLRSVTSTRGQALILEYSGMYVSKACVLNLAKIAKPSNNTCPGSVPTSTYTYDSNVGEQRLASVTDPSGAVWQFVNSGSLASTTTMGFRNPGEASPWLTNTIQRMPDDEGVKDVITAQNFADGQSYTYSYYTAPEDSTGGHIPPLAGGNYVDADGHSADVQYSFPVLMGTGPGDPCSPTPCSPPTPESIVYQMTAGPTTVTDPLNRTTTTSYADPNGGFRFPLSQPQSVTDPGGIKTKMVWDLQAGNLVQSTQISRTPGTPADLIKSATYSNSMKSLHKPLSFTDAKGFTTNFTYAPEHGGVLTEMKPAPASGAARPLKVTTWTQKYAYILGGGSLVAAAAPVWVINSETVCQTAAGTSPAAVCDGAAPQRVTNYQYGADGTANNLFVRGIAVTADGATRRTCFTYDDQGNQISKTMPRAGLASCP